LRGLGSRRLEIVLVSTTARTTDLEVCKRLAAEPGRAVTVLSLSPISASTTRSWPDLPGARRLSITMDDDLQNPPARSRALFDTRAGATTTRSTTYYSEKQHAAWRNWEPFTNWCADRLIDKPPGLYLELPLHFRFLRERHRVGLRGAGSLCRWPDLPGHPECRRLQVITCRERGALELHAAPAVRCGFDVLNFSVCRSGRHLFGVASALGPDRRGHRHPGKRSSRNKPPQGWASLMVAVLVLAGVQLVVVGLIGEYVGRMFLAVNRKPQYLVREVFHRGPSGLEVEGRSRHAPQASRTVNRVSKGVLNDDGLLRATGHRHRGRIAGQSCSRPAPTPRLREPDPAAVDALRMALYASAAFLYLIALRQDPGLGRLSQRALSYAIVAVLGHFLFGEPFASSRSAHALIMAAWC